MYVAKWRCHLHDHNCHHCYSKTPPLNACLLCVCAYVCTHSSTKVIALLDASRRNAMAVRRSPVRDRDIHREWVTDWMSYCRAIIQTHIIPPIHPLSYNRRPSTLTTITIRSHPWQGDGLCKQTDRHRLVPTWQSYVPIDKLSDCKS